MRSYVVGVAFPKEGMQVAVGGGGAWHSHDEGRNWLRRGDGLDPLIHTIQEHPEQRDRLFATTSTGFFRSDDAWATWVRLNDDQHQFGFCGIITGDPRVYGRVYIGTGGRGIVYGEPK